MMSSGDVLDILRDGGCRGDHGVVGDGYAFRITGGPGCIDDGGEVHVDSAPPGRLGRPIREIVEGNGSRPGGQFVGQQTAAGDKTMNGRNAFPVPP